MSAHSLPRRATAVRQPLQSPRRRWVGGVVLVVVLMGVSAGGWWWWHRPVAIVPPMPANISDPDIRRVVQKGRQAVLDKPQSAVAWGQYGMVLEAHLFEAEADRCFTEAARLDPGDVRWPYFRFLCVRQTDLKKGTSFLRQAAACKSLKDYQSAVNLRLAEALVEQQQYDEAESIYRRELEEQPGRENPRVAYGLGLIAIARKDFKAAEEFLQIARKSPSARRQSLAQLAVLAQSRGDDATAAALTSEAAPRQDDESTWPDPLLDMIALLQVGPNVREEQIRQFEQHHDFEGALQLYRRQLEEAPTSKAYLGAGTNCARLNDYDNALRYLKESIRLDPENAEAHYILGLTLFDHALKEWRQSANSPQAKAGFEEAVQHTREATRLKPDHAHAYLFLGLALKYSGDRKAAISQLRNGVQCQPSDLELQLNLGDTLLENGEAREAEIYLENARKLAANDPRVLRALELLRQKKDDTRSP